MSEPYLMPCGHTVQIPHGGSAKCEPCAALAGYLNEQVARSDAALRTAPPPPPRTEMTVAEQFPYATRCCPGDGSMAHVRGCVNHPEAARMTAEQTSAGKQPPPRPKRPMEDSPYRGESR